MCYYPTLLACGSGRLWPGGFKWCELAELWLSPLSRSTVWASRDSQRARCGLAQLWPCQNKYANEHTQTHTHVSIKTHSSALLFLHLSAVPPISPSSVSSSVVGVELLISIAMNTLPEDGEGKAMCACFCVFVCVGHCYFCLISWFPMTSCRRLSQLDETHEVREEVICIFQQEVLMDCSLRLAPFVNLTVFQAMANIPPKCKQFEQAPLSQ